MSRVRRSRYHRLAVALLLLLSSGVPAARASEAQSAEAAPAAPALTAEALAATALFDLPAEEWREPSVIRSQDGRLRVDMRVAYAEHQVRDAQGNPLRLRLRSYNGGIVGPTLRVKAGDTLFMTLINDLPPETGPEATDAEAAAAHHHAAMKECPNVPHDFNTTNMHTHGLHISPRPPADDVFQAVRPGGRFGYVFPILPAGNPPGQPPAQHYPGTFWYHAHRHGSTALQLASGMAGTLIVEGDVDQVPEIRSAGERLFVFQQIAHDRNGRVESFGDLRSNWVNVVGEHTRINGVLKPRFILRPGQIERWRMVDAGIFGDVPFHVVPATPGAPGFRTYRIAVDGITLPAPQPVAEVQLAPGYRTDLLVQAPLAEGVYYLRKKTSQFDFTVADDPSPAGPQILAEIVVQGRPCERSQPGCGLGIPTALPHANPILRDVEDREIVARKDVTFSVKTEPLRFLIEDQCFDPDVTLPKFQVTRNTAEEWTLKNTSGGPHPFHIHVNAFQVMEPEGRTWHDTIVIPPGGSVKIRSRFERFDGRFVTHCHILTHEDLGMMQTVEIR